MGKRTFGTFKIQMERNQLTYTLSASRIAISSMMNYPGRILMPLALLMIIAGITGGLLRLGADLGDVPKGLVLTHGILITGGFFGTLISIERYAMTRNAGFLLSVLCSLAGGLFFIFEKSIPGTFLMITAAIIQSVVFIQFLISQPSVSHRLFSGGSLCWLAGNITWLTNPASITGWCWWIAFLLLIITGEHNELTAAGANPKRNKTWLVKAEISIISGLLISSFYDFGFYLFLGGMMVMAWFHFHYNPENALIGQKDNLKFTGITAKTGYFWLVVSSVAGLFFIHFHLYRDIFLHTFFLGFIFSMFFAHGPFILPLVLGIKGPVFSNWFYFPFALLNAGLILRITGRVLPSGDILLQGAFLSSAGIVIFFLIAGSLIFIKLHQRNSFHT
jgi:hypothetical protein